MSQNFEPNNGTNSPLAQVFQDAYQKAMTVRRLDEQIQQLAGRRKALCEELKSIQLSLNEEFVRLLETEPSIPAEEIPTPRVKVGMGPKLAGRAAAEAAVA